MIYWSDLNSNSRYKNGIASNYYKFKDWDEVYTNADIMDPDGTCSYNESIQGSAGTCYFVAGMASIGEFPQLVRDMFLTQNKNDAHAIAIRFFIRGKPWAVTVNEEMMFNSNLNSLIFSKPANDQNSMWAAILEKAWAKVKGNYMISEYGYMENGIRVVTGIPVFRYNTYYIRN